MYVNKQKEEKKKKKSYKREKLVCQQSMIECASSSCTGSASIVEGPLFPCRTIDFMLEVATF